MTDPAQKAAAELAEHHKQLDEKIPRTIPVGEKQQRVWPGRYEAKGLPKVLEKKYLAKRYGLEPTVTVSVSDEDIRILEEKRKMLDQIQFDQWFHENWGKKIYEDPTIAEWAQKIYPAYFSNREQALKDLIDLQEKFALIGIRGVQNLEDIYMVYNLCRNPELVEKLKKPFKTEKALGFPALHEEESFQKSFLDFQKLASIYAGTQIEDPMKSFQKYWKRQQTPLTRTEMEELGERVPAAIKTTGFTPYAWIRKTEREIAEEARETEAEALRRERAFYEEF